MADIKGTWVWEIKEATGTYEEFTFGDNKAVTSYEDHCLFGESREGTYSVEGDEVRVFFSKADDRVLKILDNRLEDRSLGRIYRKSPYRRLSGDVPDKQVF